MTKNVAKLLTSLSETDPNDPLLDEVTEKLDRQPLALAAAAVYMKRVFQSNFSPQFSVEKLFGKTRDEGIEKSLRSSLWNATTSTYSSTMSAAVLLAVARCAEDDPILKHAFQFLSFVSFEPLPT